MASLHSVAGELDSQLKAMVLDIANNNPAPRIATITKVSDDKNFVNIELGGGTLRGVEAFGYPIVGTKVIVVFIDGSTSYPMAICNPMNMVSYTDPTPNYNIFTNGNFARGIEGWTGGKLNTSYARYGMQSIQATYGTTLISPLIDLSLLPVTDEERSSTVAMVTYWYTGATHNLRVLDEDGSPLYYMPDTLQESVLASDGIVDDWAFQRFSFKVADHSKIKLEFTVTDKDYTTMIDGIRVWTTDEYIDWYPSVEDSDGTS